MYREGNHSMDFLGHLGVVTVREDRVWEHPPMGLEHVLLDDMTGAAQLR